MDQSQIVIVGGGAAGCFAAIACAEAGISARVTVLEKGAQLLAKVRISGGGRCNVTHACFDPRELVAFYPRGSKELLGPFHRFQPRDTMGWFESRGVRLKTESDGRVFPVTDSSQTVIDSLLNAAIKKGVQFRTHQSVTAIKHLKTGAFELRLNGGDELLCDRVLLATGGCRAPAMAALATGLGHSLKEPVPSLFTFQLNGHWLQHLPGVALQAQVQVPETRLCERGPVLLTHEGLSGPAILRVSAWGARVLHDRNYRFRLRVNWLPQLSLEQVRTEVARLRVRQAARLVVNAPLSALPARFWEAVVLAAGVSRATRWAELSRAAQHQLMTQLTATEVEVTGKSLNKDEFVTCGGIPLREVNFQSMESRVCQGLYFAGELLDIDGVTGGFNFQAAWTTGWIAGRAMASSV